MVGHFTDHGDDIDNPVLNFGPELNNAPVASDELMKLSQDVTLQAESSDASILKITRSRVGGHGGPLPLPIFGKNEKKCVSNKRIF